jgi:hypothetical protein
MRMVPAGFATLAPLLLVLAGCVGSESAALGGDGAAPSGPQATAAAAEFDDLTGAIQGLVLDLELQAIVGAQVGILPSETIADPVIAMTDAAGAFSMSRIAPGEHTLNAQMLGFRSAAKRINVNAGEVTTIQFALEKLPSDEPFHFVDIRKAAVTGVMVKLTPQCMYGTQAVPPTGNPTVDQFRTTVKTCNGQRNQCDPAPNCEVHYRQLLEENFGWVTQLAEATWAAQSGVTGRGFMFDITAPNATRGFGGSIDQANPYTFFRMQPNPPIIWRINNPETLVERGIQEKDWCCDWFYRVFPGYCDLGGIVGNVAVQLRVDISKPSFVTLVLVAGALSGCIQAESAAPPGPAANQPQVASGPAQFDDTTGGIEGVVTDVELQPVSGAIVGILRSDTIQEPITVITDAAGGFSMSHVPPGEHVLQASALGYTAASKRVIVEAGGLSSASLVLDKIPIEEA